jgi:DNA-binding MarR family transcriptional regulator
MDVAHPTLELKRAYLALRRALEHTVRPFGFTAGQFDVLQLLMHNDGLEHRDLQRRLAIASPTLTNILDVLERQGHIIRRQESDDARVKKIYITPEARKICFSESFCNAGDNLVEQMFRDFSRKERNEFVSLLHRVEQNLEQASQ